MNRHLLLFLSCLLVCLLPLALGAQQGSEEALSGPRTVILVRHAEKAKEGGADPELSVAGAARARKLASMLAGAGVTHLFSSEYLRTQATLQPLADKLDLELSVRPARETGTLLDELRALPDGAVAVLAGHSNTVPAIVRGLGGRGPDSLSEDEYDKLFVLTLGMEGCGVSTLQLSFGSVARETAGHGAR